MKRRVEFDVLYGDASLKVSAETECLRLMPTEYAVTLHSVDACDIAGILGNKQFVEALANTAERKLNIEKRIS